MSNFEKKNIHIVKEVGNKEVLNEDEQKNVFLSILRKRKIEGINGESEPILNEVEKTEIEKKFITNWTDLINKEKKNVNSDGEDFNIEFLEQIHFCDFEPGEIPKNEFGFFNNIEQNLYIRAELNLMDKYKTLLHEMIHMSAVSKITSYENFSRFSDRTGYSLNTCSKRKLNLFNEAVTEKMTKEIFKKDLNFVSKNLNLEKKDIEEYSSKEDLAYKYEIKVLDIIMKKTSEKLGIEQDYIWEKLKKEYFDGGLMHLRDFERVYGKGFLKIISSLDYIFFKSNCEFEEITFFLKETDFDKRNKILKEILPEKNYEKYLEILNS